MGRGVQRGHPRVRGEGEVVAEVLPLDPVVLPGEEAVVARSGHPACEVDGRVDQQLGDERALRVPAVQGDHGGEVASCAVAGHGDPVGPPAKLVDVVECPLDGRDAALVRGRERVLRGQPVADVDHDGADGGGQPAGVAVMRVQVADDPAAAVEEDDRGPGGLLGPVDPHGDVPGRTGDRALVDALDVHQHGRVVGGPHVDAAAAGLVRGGVVEQRGFAVVLHGLQHPGDVGVQDKAVLDEVPVRRATYEQYAALPPYPALIVGHFDPVRWAADPGRRSDLYDARGGTVPASDTVAGFPGAPGVVEGIARVIRSPEQGDRLQPGDVLVTTVTNVGWTPLFPRAAAVVTDLGAPLSHASIVARELGIPAVVGTGNATMRLRDGVRVDGERGTVEVLT